MDTRLKHRLIAAVVLLALLIIFVPMLFNQHVRNQPLNTAMPIPPPEPVVNVTKPTTPPTVTQADIPQPVIHSAPKPAIPQSLTTQVEASEKTALKPKVKYLDQQKMIKDILASAKRKAAIHDVKTASKTLKTGSVKVLPVQTKHQYAVNIKTFNVAKPKKSITPVKSKLTKAKSHNQAWVVQLGSFVNTQNAYRLISQLRKKHFTAFGYTVPVKGKMVSKVYVGPAVKITEAEAMKGKLQKTMHIKGFIVAFDATKLE